MFEIDTMGAKAIHHMEIYYTCALVFPDCNVCVFTYINYVLVNVDCH